MIFSMLQLSREYRGVRIHGPPTLELFTPERADDIRAMFRCNVRDDDILKHFSPENQSTIVH